MGIVSFQIPASNVPAARSDRPKAKLWLNIGYEKNGRFVNLPVGMPLDTMEPTKIQGQNEDWVKFQSARNGLLDALKAFGAQLTPGQEVDIPDLVIKIRRVNEDMQVEQDDNEYAVDFTGLILGNRGAVQQQAAE